MSVSAFWKSLFQPKAPNSEAGGGGLQEKPLYKPQEMITIGNSLKVSPMGLGTWAWGNQLLWGYDESQDPELQDLFDLVVASGVNLFDTADSYGTGRLNGKSEQLLGRFISEYPGSFEFKDTVHVATKFAAYPWRLLPANVVAACRGSMRRLDTQRIAIGQLHWSTANYQPLQEMAMQAGLADCYEQGLVSEVGVSNYGPKQLQRIQEYLAGRGVPLATAQIQFSLLSWGTAQQDLKALCDDLGIVVIAYSPLALGVLTGKYSVEGDRLPAGPRGLLFRKLLPEVQPLVQVLNEVAAERRKTPSQVAINWCMAKGTVPIPGAKNLEQARDNLGALGWKLGAGEVAELDAAARRLSRSGRMVQNIFQTA